MDASLYITLVYLVHQDVRLLVSMINGVEQASPTRALMAHARQIISVSLQSTMYRM